MKKTLSLLAFLLIALSNAYADQVTFDFDANYANLFPALSGTSSNDSHDGDITTDMTTPAIGGVTITVSAKTSGNTENRIWSSAPRLRMYSGKLTVEAASSITAIEFSGNTNFNLTPDVGKLDGKVWKGNAQKIVFSVAKNTQINSMVVYLGGDGPVAADTVEVSIKDFKAAGVSTKKWYKLTGKVSGIQSTDVYGNFDLYDGADSVYVYGLLSYNGGPAKDFQNLISKTGLSDGTTLTLIGQRGEYEGKIEVVNAYYVSSDGGGEVAVQAPVISFDEATKTVTITDPSGNNNSIFYTIDGTNPDDSKLFYEAPFTINATTTVKAICYDDLDQTSAITTKVCSVAGDGLKTCADLIANCTTTEGVNITFEFTDLLVTSASGAYVFVKDNTAPFLLYKNSSYKRGYKLTGSVSGKLYLYNGVMELSVNDWNNVTVASSSNDVTPEKVAVADVTAAIQNKYIRVEGLKHARTDGQYFYFTDGTNELTVFDKFNVMSGVAISESNTYNINGVATIYKENPQVYVFDIKDVEVISTKADPQTKMEKSDYKALLSEKTVNIKFETKSDAKQIWTSTNADVANVEGGVVTLLGTGFTEITLETEENETYQASKATMNLYVFSGADATENNPYDAGEVQAAMLYQKTDTISDVWVKGYIVGFANGSLSKAVFGTEGAIASNILLAKNPNETDINMCIPVALETKSDAAKTIRAELNLVDNPGNLGKEVLLNGSIIKYFSVPGMKSLKAYHFTEGGKKGDADEDGEVTVSDITSIASYILGNNSQPFNFNNADVDGDNEITVSDITGTASIILGTN